MHTAQCSKTTFVEQVDGLTVRYQRRTPALQQLLGAVAAALAGKTAARLLPHLHQLVICSTLLTMLMALPLPTLPVPRVLGVEDFARIEDDQLTGAAVNLIASTRGSPANLMPAPAPARWQHFAPPHNDGAKQPAPNSPTVISGLVVPPAVDENLVVHAPLTPGLCGALEPDQQCGAGGPGHVMWLLRARTSDSSRRGLPRGGRRRCRMHCGEES